MKIIDNKKDYYDYLMGVIGMDSKYTYDRRHSETWEHFKRTTLPSYLEDIDPSEMKVRIGHHVYSIVKDKNNKWTMPKELKKYKWRNECEMIPNPFLTTDEDMKFDEDTSVTSITLRYYTSGRMYPTDLTYTVSDPILTTFPAVSRFISPQEAWDNIYDYLASQYDKLIVDTRTEKQRIESAGFDNKTSFRNM